MLRSANLKFNQLLKIDNKTYWNYKMIILQNYREVIQQGTYGIGTIFRQ